MKRLVSLFLGLVFVLSFVSVAMADVVIPDQQYAKAENQVEKANEKISEFVSKAVVEADKKISQYTDKVLDMEADKDSFIEELNQLTIEIGSLDAESKNYDKIHNKIEKIYAIIDNNEELMLLTQNLEADLDKIIAELIQKTSKIANKTIEDAAKEGIIVECEMIEVMIGNETVLIDPLRIRRY